jgi:hypothetical protein
VNQVSKLKVGKYTVESIPDRVDLNSPSNSNTNFERLLKQRRMQNDSNLAKDLLDFR